MSSARKGILVPNGRIAGSETLDEYMARGGYEALRRIAESLTPPEVVQEIVASGLQGRGGAGFPTGKKWELAVTNHASPRYVVANGGEDEPGSVKDRLVMENHPHLVLEGLLLSAFAVGAETAYLYVNHTLDKAIKRLEDALREARERSFVGTAILGTSVNVEVNICRAPTEYVAGEDTAALEVIEGKKPLPRQKPPYPTTAGLFGQPTVVNNVETVANIPAIIRNGAQWYRQYGTKESPGTMLFSLGEEVVQPGVYELPLGTPLRFLIYECGGGPRWNSELKAILPGGPSSAFLLPNQLETPLDHQSMRAAGSALGCGVVRLIPQGVCMVEEVLRIADFFSRESCDQCPACRMETNTLVALLQRVQKGQGDKVLLDQFSKVLEFNRGKGFCALINMPGPPILSAIRLFRTDFDSHLTTGTCPR